MIGDRGARVILPLGASYTPLHVKLNEHVLVYGSCLDPGMVLFPVR
jgi:hypothetical protein